MRRIFLATALLLAGVGLSHAAPVYTTQVVVPFDASASGPTPQSPAAASNTVAYTVKFGTDATNVYVEVVAATTPTLNFSNIYLGGTFSGLGIEVTNGMAFKPTVGVKFDLTGTGFAYTATPGDIAFSLPLAFLETDPLGIGFSKVKTGDLLRISFSQSFGYNFVGGSAVPDPVGRLGSFIVPPLAVPEPASIALLGTGLIGLTGWRRRRAG